MCRHIYDWNIVNCDVKQPIYLPTLPTSHTTIFQSYMWRHRCTGGLKKKFYLRLGSQRHRHFAGFFNVPVLHRHGTTLFIRWFRHTAPFSRLLQHAGDTEDVYPTCTPGVESKRYLIHVLRRISDYGYITVPLYSPFTTRWGYGGRTLDLNPRRPYVGI